jgi:hypothetical protein
MPGLTRRDLLKVAAGGAAVQGRTERGISARTRREPWKAGFSRVLITPTEPVWLAGYEGMRVPEGVLDDLWMKALALEDGRGTRLVLITSDFQGVPRSMSDRIFKALASEYRLTRANVILTFSHNHCGGDQNPVPRHSTQLCRDYGHALAESVERLLESGMKPVSAGARSAFRSVDLQYEEVAGRELLADSAVHGNAIKQRWATRLIGELDRGRVFDSAYPYPVHAWRLGQEWLVIGLGAEAVVDYALRFKREYGPGTWVCGYVDDMVAYIPSRRVWEEGGYEGGSRIFEYGHPALRWGGDIEDRIASAVHQVVREVGASILETR